MSATKQKLIGSFYTPDDVAHTLVRWVVRQPTDRLLDPSCGDGRFLVAHENTVGVECDISAVVAATRNSRSSVIHVADFFDWAMHTRDRFECAAGNPPFIRYQRFAGETRKRALQHCGRLGVKFSALTSSWAPFLVAAANLLQQGGRMAFVVPAEIGHAPYAAPLISHLTQNFRLVQIIAIRKKIFPDLSEDAWLLYAEGFGERTDRIKFTKYDSFRRTSAPPTGGISISISDWIKRNRRVRSFLLSEQTLDFYDRVIAMKAARRLGEIAEVGIGYVTGANDFFHFRPSTAQAVGIPERFLQPSVRTARFLPRKMVTGATIKEWITKDQQVLLLHIRPGSTLPEPILRYLSSKDASQARQAYKCRNREPWYVVPDVKFPDAFLSYMSGRVPSLVENAAHCTCTNALHAVRLKNGIGVKSLQKLWQHPLTQLSCEIEGHPLGGGMLKLEPREATRVVLPKKADGISRSDLHVIGTGLDTLRAWRHYD